MSGTASEGGDANEPASPVGLCGTCRHARVQRSSRGSEFWRCGRADDDDRWLRYPPLPVERCEGHERESDGPGSDC